MDKSVSTGLAPLDTPKHADGVTYVCSIAAAALGALALWIPSGYSIGALGLLLCGFWLLLKHGLPRLSVWEWALICTMFAYSIVWMIDALLRGDGVPGMDQASRFLFAIPVLLGVAHITLRWDLIWLGVGAGGYGALGIAVFQVYQNGMVRASGFIGPEPFGNICALIAGLSLLGAIWLHNEKRHPMLYLLTALGGLAAVAALALSGTRAGWLALFPVLLIVLVLLWVQAKGQQRLTVTASILVVLMLVGGLLIEPIGERVNATYSDLNNYFEGIGHPQSVGNRFELWKGSLHLFSQSPWVGWGTEAYRIEMGNLAGSGYIKGDPNGANHAHNELIDALAKKGLLGGVLVLLIYIVPGLLFLRCFMQSSNISHQILSIAGLVVVITSGLYGMAHTALENNAGVMNYAFWMSLLIGSVSARASE